jgi:hypothetical protein
MGGAGEENKESLYRQLTSVVVGLEHFEVVQQENAVKPIIRNIPDGTGFFVHDSNDVYVVSARHIVEKPYDLHARVQCRNNKTGEREVVLLELPRSAWVHHNNIGDSDTQFVDVAVMKIPARKDYSIVAFRYEPKKSNQHAQNQLPLEDPEPPRAILVSGFPAGVGFQLTEQKPLVRFGIISMNAEREFLKLDGKKFAEERCLLIDARMFPGNSGSPVMNQPSITDSRPSLLGLVIASNETLDFGVMEPVSRIRETLDLARDRCKAGVWKPISKPKEKPAGPAQKK